MTEQKTIKDLTNREILEDLEYYLDFAQMQAPSFMDGTFVILNKYLNELFERDAL